MPCLIPYLSPYLFWVDNCREQNLEVILNVIPCLIPYLTPYLFWVNNCCRQNSVLQWGFGTQF
jgi:hypothetical protein